jgi:hypothetical protein
LLVARVVRMTVLVVVQVGLELVLLYLLPPELHIPLLLDQEVLEEAQTGQADQMGATQSLALLHQTVAVEVEQLLSPVEQMD